MCKSILYMEIHKLHQTLTFLHLWGIGKTISRHSFFVLFLAFVHETALQKSPPLFALPAFFETVAAGS